MIVLVAFELAGKPAAISSFADALSAFRQADYARAARVLSTRRSILAKNPDYLLYFAGESLFYAANYAKAADTFAELAKLRDSRFAPLAPWRAADCLWMEGKRVPAAAAYRKLLGGKANADRAVARFRVAEVEAMAALATKDEAAVARAAQAFLKIHIDFPAHPLGQQAEERAAALAAGGPAPGRSELTAQERLQRARALTKGHYWQEAEDELLRLPASLPAELAAERDLALGMAKYHSRRDYAGAAALLLGVAPRLAGDQAALAMFHGARALSRIDRNDEAIADYRAVVAQYPGASWAAEAQFRAGWLEINRGRFRQALPDLQGTLLRYPHSSFAADAAWYLTLAHYLLGDAGQAEIALARYERLTPKSEESAMRACYWRARIAALAGETARSRELLHSCVVRGPFNYYGLLARARLRQSGEVIPWPKLPDRGLLAPKLPHPDALVSRVLELEQAGLVQEAGLELERGEVKILKRNGKAQALPFLLATYPRLLNYHRAQQLADTLGPGSVPDERLFWQAAYPRAFAPAVVKYGQAGGTPELFTYAVMRKESGYYPFALSSSDARGLLQLIPATGELLAQKLGLGSYADELYDPDLNIRLGTAYLGGLYRRFQSQEALAAGAYNAGARAMMRWCDEWGDRPLDEFVELITYDQAREYIKRVLGIYARYRHLYGEPLELALTVDAHYHADGPDF